MSGLDAFADAYQPTFPYHRENLGMQAVYSGLLEKAIHSRGAKRILSLGIGHSVVSFALRRLMPDPVEQYLIVEGSRKLVEQLRSQLSGLHRPTIVESVFEDFETQDRFDLIEMGFILEHVADPRLILQRMKTLMPPGGIVAVAVPNARSLHRMIGAEAGLLDDVMKLSEHDRELGHHRYFDRADLEALVTDSGFRVGAVKGLMLKPLTTSQLAAANLDERVMQALYRSALELPDIANALYLEAIPN